MFKAMIVEDEQPILDLMKHVIGQNPHYTIVGAFTSPLEALACLPDLSPQVVFLDVEMPRINGLELGRKINELSEQIKIVFTTAHRQYALDAFEVYAFDYVLKPVTPAAIDRVTNRLFKQLRVTTEVVFQPRQASIRCFGSFEIRNPDGLPLRWPTKKTEELFAYFLCNPGRVMSKWHLTDLLWTDMDAERATHNLHNTIYRLKKLLKEQDLGMEIQKASEGYRLLPLGQMYDVLAFQQHALSYRAKPQSPGEAEELCSLYKGPLLEGKDYLWKAPLEEGFSKQYTQLLSSLIEQDVANRDLQRAEGRLDTYLAWYPLNEAMNWKLLDIYTRSGQQQKLVSHYGRFAEAYRLELGLEPPEELRIWVAPYLF